MREVVRSDDPDGRPDCRERVAVGVEGQPCRPGAALAMAALAEPAAGIVFAESVVHVVDGNLSRRVLCEEEKVSRHDRRRHQNSHEFPRHERLLRRWVVRVVYLTRQPLEPGFPK